MGILLKRAVFCLFALSVLSLLQLTGVQASEQARHEAAADSEVAATVNGFPIPEKLLAAEVKQQLEKYARYGMRKATPELSATLRQQALDRLIDQEVLRQASSRMEVKDAEEQARQKLASMQAGFKSPEQLQSYLASRNMTTEKFVENYRGKLQMDAYLASLGLADIRPTEEQIAAYYQRTKENFKREESVKVRHILIAVAPEASAKAKAQARRQAEDLRSQLKDDSELFPRLAAEFSGCAQSRNKGGDLGYIKHGFMPPEFDAKAFTLPQGEISDVVSTKFGFHILQVIEKSPAGYASLAEMHDFISKYLQDDMAAKKKAAHIKELRSQAVITVLPDRSNIK